MNRLILKPVLKPVFTLFLACFSTVALGASATLTWSHPIQNMDGSMIPVEGAGSIVQTRVEWGSCTAGGGFGTKESDVIVLYPENSVTLENFVGGETVCFRAFSKNTYGMESDSSAVVAKTFDAPKPKAPVLSSVIAVAYQVKTNRKGEIKLARNVGTIAVGTPCVESPVYTNKGLFYPVDFQYVTFKRKPKSSVVVTKCEMV